LVGRLSWHGAEVSTQEIGIWLQAMSICSLYPITLRMLDQDFDVDLIELPTRS
jgi:hypothetical protein